MKVKFTVFILGLSAVLSVQAAGLGAMTASSKLGEPLRAEIELLAVTPQELGSLRAALASEDVYQDQQLEKPASYGLITISVGQNGKGQPVLTLSSTQAITEAFLDMLIQVDWPTGRLIKEYTLLLDPPGFDSNSVSESTQLPVTAESTSKSGNKLSESAAKPVVTPSTTTRANSESATVSSQTAPSGNGVQVRKGDTLLALARQYQPDNVSLTQTLAGLYQANPQAFIDNNMHRLREGAIVTVPDQATLAALSQRQASQIVNAQHHQWNRYKNSLSQVVEASAVRPPANVPAQTASGKIAPVTRAETNPASTSKDVLKLSAGDEKSTAQGDKAARKASEEKATALQEELTAKENALQEQKSRTLALEKQVEDMQKLLALKSAAMAQLESAAKQNKSEEAPAATTAPSAAPSTANEHVSAAKSEQSPETHKETPAENTAVHTVDKPAESSAGVAGFLATLQERFKKNGPLLPLSLGGLIILSLIWLFTRQKHKKSLQLADTGLLTTPATQSLNTVFGQTQSATVSDTAFLTDFSQTAVGGVLESQEVDPVAEAEVYMAYGRHAQAEEILKDALQKDPGRQELTLKLLDIYHQTEQVAAFETLASSLYAQTGLNDPVWNKVAQMGATLDPSNPRYRRQDSTPVVSDVASSVAIADNTSFTSVPSMVESDVSAVPDHVDVQTAEPAQAVAANPYAEAQFASGGLDDSDSNAKTIEAIPFSDAGVRPDNSPAEAAPPSAPKGIAFPSLEFDQTPADAKLLVVDSAPIEALAEDDAVFEQIPDLSFGAELEPDPSIANGLTLEELPAESTLDEVQSSARPDADDLSSADSVQAKLDLIEAYIAMEDVVGAKELIAEVRKEGNAAQIARAEALGAQLM